MTAKRFAARHSILDELELAELLGTRYELGRSVRCRLLRCSMSHAYRVQASSGAYVLKVHIRGRHTRQAIEAEVRFLSDLLAHDVAVASPVPDRDGGYVLAIDAPEGTRYAVLFKTVEGAEPDETRHEDNVSFGRLVARLHNCADGLDRTYERWELDGKYLVEQALAGLEPRMGHREQDFEYLCGVGRDLVAEVERRLPKTAPQHGMVHGDLHTGNTRFDETGRIVLFDFDTCGYGWRALDVGTYAANHRWLNTSDEAATTRERMWESFLEGYAAQRTLSDDELAVGRLGVPLRHFELIGITIRYWAPQTGDYWINDEYFDVHVGWFKWWLKKYGIA
jgi:Ser/Thr protein kinase RdoA (MazF antagonist)